MTILITGASRGIGAEVALNLAKENHKLLLVSRTEHLVNEVAEKCNSISDGGNAHPILFDINDLDNLADEFLSVILKYTDSIDSVINNAGFLVRKPFAEFKQSEAAEMISANLLAPANLIRIIIPLLKNAATPHVVNITSMAGFQGGSKFAGLSWYSASKAAFASLTECLAEEYREKGISFNGLALGAVQTEMLEKAFPGLKAPLSSSEMAEFISWFALNGQRFFNGKHLPVSLKTP